MLSLIGVSGSQQGWNKVGAPAPGRSLFTTDGVLSFEEVRTEGFLFLESKASADLEQAYFCAFCIVWGRWAGLID